MTDLHLGFEVGSGEPVRIPPKHMVVTGQTQEAGKTTALEALIARSGVSAIAFITKRGEGTFADARVIAPYFREQADWQFVASILEASRGEKLKFERAWIIRASKGAQTLGDVHRNVRKSLETAKGMSADVYLTLDAYLDVVVPQIARVHWAPTVDLQPGINVMDMTALPTEMQHLVIRSTILWVLHNAERTVVVVPEAWKFIPQGRGTPVKLAAEEYIRQGAGLGNYLWLDSQDIAGVEKIILKSVPVWLLGVQRESNEIKRTLAQIPASFKKPKPDEIATLELGQFFACHGKHTIKTYVQPVWMDAAQAQAIARGELQYVPSLDVRREKRAEPKTGLQPIPGFAFPPASLIATIEERHVNEKEARELQNENRDLRKQNDDLVLQVDELRKRIMLAEGRDKPPEFKVEPIRPSPEFNGDEDALYQRFRDRLAKEAPKLLKVLTVRPEIEVEYTPEVIKASGDGLRGRIARLLKEGFFDDGQILADAMRELARRGFNPDRSNTQRELTALAELGFFTVEEGKDSSSRPRTAYRAVPGMKVNVVGER